jgi:hypothetical protein
MRANPLFWLHVRLSGSWRTNIPIVTGYAALVTVIAAITYRLNAPEDWGRVSAIWLGILTAAQGFFVLLLGLGAIRRAVQRDFQTGMIESHRLSPLSAFRIVAGYMSGPPVQAAWLFGTGLLLGTYFAADLARQFTPAVLTSWYALQLALLLLAFMLAALALLAALSTAGKANVIAVALVVAFLGGGIVVFVVPGLALLTGTLGGGILISGIFGGGIPGLGGDQRGVAVAAAAQVAFGVVFLLAACHKVRAPERAIFGMGLGLLLTLLWGTTLVLGEINMPPGHWLQRDFEHWGTAQLVASTGAFMLVALFPLVGAAAARFHLDRAAAFGASGSPVRGRAALFMPFLLGVLAMATLALLYELKPGGWSVDVSGAEDLDEVFTDWRRKAAMLAALVIAFWVDFNCIYWAITRGWRVFPLVALTTLVWKVLPLVADLAATAVFREMGDPRNFVDMYFAGFSPVGTILLCLLNGDPWPGLLAQTLFVVGAAWLGWRTRQAVLAGTTTARREPTSAATAPSS